MARGTPSAYWTENMTRFNIGARRTLGWQREAWRLPEIAGTPFDDKQAAPVPAPLVVAIIVMAYASFVAYLLNSFAIEQFHTEVTRLIDKFLW